MIFLDKSKIKDLVMEFQSEQAEKRAVYEYSLIEKRKKKEGLHITKKPKAKGKG